MPTFRETYMSTIFTSYLHTFRETYISTLPTTDQSAD